jgi:hypothetical protein
VTTPSLWTFLRQRLAKHFVTRPGPEDGQATVGSPERPVMEGVDAVAGEAAHVGASTFYVIERGQPEGFVPPEYIWAVSYYDGETWSPEIDLAAKWNTAAEAQQWIDAYGIQGRPVEHGYFAGHA